MDSDSIIRVEGSLDHSYLGYATMHPVILKGNERIVRDLIVERHKILGHMGRNTIANSIRKNYWITGINSCIKSLLYNCITCRKLNAQPTYQKVTSLPADRLAADEPALTNTRTDFFAKSRESSNFPVAERIKATVILIRAGDSGSIPKGCWCFFFVLAGMTSLSPG